MQKMIKTDGRSKSKENSREERQRKLQHFAANSLDGIGKIALIQMLIPIGLKAVEEVLQEEVSSLAGEKYSREGVVTRWGYNPGSVYMGDQKVAVKVPRLVNSSNGKFVALESYRSLQDGAMLDEGAFRKVLSGMRMGHYEEAVTHVPQTFGIKKSSISRKFIRTSGKRLKKFLKRALNDEDIIAIFIDGKHFAGNEIIIAVGVTITGEKIILGFVESGTENQEVCKDFMQGLIDRGLKIEDEILFIIDGSKGLYNGIKTVLGEKALIQRCQWHKRENVVSYLGKKHQSKFREKLQEAYSENSYEEARKSLLSIKRELKLINGSAVSSLEEGFEETLTLHRLGMFSKLGTSFKTTNCIETLNHQLAIYTDRVDCWKNSDQRQRWVGCSLVEIEPRLRKVKGHKYLRELREQMKTVFIKQQKIAA